MNGRSRASQMIDLIHFQEDWLNDVVSNEFEHGIPKKMNQIAFPPSKEIIDNDHFIASSDQLINKMTPDEPRPTRDYDPHSPPSDPNRYPPRLANNGLAISGGIGTGRVLVMRDVLGERSGDRGTGIGRA
ncbi:hypothetical protein V6N13_030097 [Hibiscus sabdariffa]